jgi:hypothetical protein
MNVLVGLARTATLTITTTFTSTTAKLSRAPLQMRILLRTCSAVAEAAMDQDGLAADRSGRIFPGELRRQREQ